jgi:hypothetical protein
MNAPMHFEAADERNQGKKHFRNRDLNTVSERTSFNKSKQPPSKTRPNVHDDRTFETFIDGAGI